MSAELDTTAFEIALEALSEHWRKLVSLIKKATNNKDWNLVQRYTRNIEAVEFKISGLHEQLGYVN